MGDPDHLSGPTNLPSHHLDAAMNNEEKERPLKIDPKWSGDNYGRTLISTANASTYLLQHTRCATGVHVTARER